MTIEPKRESHPFLLVTLVLLIALSASLAHAQQPGRRAAVATRALARGTVLSVDDFEFRDTTMRGVTDTSRVDAGWVTRRMIAAGEVLRSPAVEPPMLVVANQAVEVEWRESNVRLTFRGTVTRGAALGERVTVRTDAGRRMEATVVAAGRVRLD